MEFKYLTNEKEETIELINNSFEKDYNSDFVLDDNQNILLLKDGNIVVGAALITEKKDPFKKVKSYYIDYLCIRKEYEHKGFGTQLLNKILELAKENDIKYLELTSNKERKRAQNMYLRFGMKIKDTDYFIKEIL